MKRTLPVILALSLTGCGLWQASSPVSGQLVVSNPLYGRFQAKVIPEGTKRLIVLVTSRSDTGGRNASLTALDASERQAIIKDIPVGPAEVVVAAFDDAFTPVAANQGEVDIPPSASGERAKLTLTLSTDEALLKKLEAALNRMKLLPRVSPTPSSNASASPSPIETPSIRPSGQASILPSRPPLPSPTALLPSPLGSPLFDLGVLTSFQETFSGTALDPVRWQGRTSGNPLPTITVANRLTLSVPPDAVPSGQSNALAEVVTARMTFFDVQATARMTVTGEVNEFTQVGIFTAGAGVYRTGNAARTASYVLERFGDARSVKMEIPAPLPGGPEEFRLTRAGLTLRAFAGPSGDMKLIGTVPAAFGAIPMHIGIRTTQGGRTGVSAAVSGAVVNLVTAPSPAP
jgi:hypothetical protein